jgi:CBS domain containing-hemolysin-like protein
MWGILAALALVALNGFFVAAEFSMVRVRPARLERLAKRGVKGAAQALRIVSEVERYLSASQIGITLASLALGWIGEPAVAHLVERGYASVAGHALGQTAHGIAVGVSFALITYLHVLLGEQIPKLLALYRAESLALFLAGPFRVAFVVMTPVRVLLEYATNAILTPFGLKGGAHGEGKLSEEELLGVIAATLARGPAAEDKRQLLERVIRFASRQARHAMVPRVDVAYLPITASGEAAIAYLRREEYSRVVLTEREDLDRVRGYLYAKDLLLDPSAPSLPDLRSVRRDVLYVPEPQSLIDVLRAMQASHTLFAVVVDEYGGTSGIVTMEDLVEEIVGEIRDEADEEEPAKIREAPGVAGAWDVEADTPLDELRRLNVEPEPDEGGDAIGAWFVRQLGRIPRRGDHARLGPFEVQVRAMHRRRVTRLRLVPHAPTMPPAPAASPLDEVDESNTAH